MFFRGYLWGSGGNEDERLDRPPNNFDIAGIPRGQWSSGFFCCLQNIVPSCILSFFCPCMMWGQVVVRSQIPLLIGMKNTLGSQVGSSGYNCFMNSWMIMVVIPAGLFLGGIFTEGGLQVFLFAAFSVFFIIFLYINGHVRTAFKMKYACRTFSVCGSVL
jgi:hypothetical protein